MRKEITSQILGALKQEDIFPDWWKSEEISIPILDNQKLAVTFMDFEPEQDKSFLREADIALTNFLKLTLKDRNDLSKFAYQNCIEFLEAVEFDELDEPLRQIRNKDDIWNFIHPSEIYVTRRPYKDRAIYVQVICECDWEQEHGLQFVFKHGKRLTRISDQDGHLTEADAYGKPDSEDKLLIQFAQIENNHKASWWKFWK